MLGCLQLSYTPMLNSGNGICANLTYTWLYRFIRINRYLVGNYFVTDPKSTVSSNPTTCYNFSVILGCVKTLDGLNLHSNPLSFPPRRVIEKGVKEILRYLKDALQVKDRRVLSAGMHS